MENTTPQLGSPLAPQENPFKNLIILPLLRFWPLAILITVSGLIAGTLFSLTKPNEYQSVGSVFVRFGQREQLPADFVPDAETGALRAGNTDVNNVFHNLNSVETFELVAESVGPETILAPYDPAAADSDSTSWPMKKLHQLQSWWFARSASFPKSYDELPEAVKNELRRRATVALQKRTVITVSRNSHVIEVTHQSPDPRISQRVTTAFLEAFNQRHRSLYSTEAFLKKVRELRDKAKEDLANVNSELNQVAQDHLVSPELLAKEKEALILSTKELWTDLETARGEREVVAKSLSDLEQRLAGEGPNPILPTVERTVEQPPLQNPEYAAHQNRVTQYQIDLDKLRDTLSATSGDPHPSIVRAEERYNRAVEELKKTEPFLEARKRTVVEANPAYEEAMNQRVELKTRLGVLEARIDTSEKLHRADSERLKLLKDLTPQIDRLQRQKALLISAVQSYERTEAENKPAEQLDESNKTNLHVLQHASLPYQKSGPNRMKYVLIGFGAGLLISLTLVALLGFADRRVRRPEDLEDIGLKVLAVVPATGGWRKAQKKAAQIPIEPSEPTPV